jgi:RNA polymerase sigma factor (sigma-70 family)
MTDAQRLLAEYVDQGSEAAFHEIVSRYVDLVYSTALRLVGGDTHRAEDITQNVFMDLARKARSLSGRVLLGGWLHRHTCFLAAHVLRGERRRQIREKEAAEMNALHHPPETDLSAIAPILDDTINELGSADRAAILLRFFEQRDYRTMAAELGGSEDAARMRVSRALEKLAALLKRRGIQTGAGALGIMLGAHSVQAAPIALATSVAAAATLAASLTTAASITTAAAVPGITMTILQKSLVTAAVLATVGTGFYEAREIIALRRQVKSMAAEQLSLSQQLEQARRERDESLGRAQTFREQAERLAGNEGEAVRLRAELNTLRRQREQVPRPAPPAQAKAGDAPGVDPSWVEQMLSGPLKQQGAAAGALRKKLLHRDTAGISGSEIALRDALVQRDLNSALEKSPVEFADFQSAFIQAALGIDDPTRGQQIHDVIRQAYDHAVANGLDIPSKPATDAEAWVQRRFQLDRLTTAQLKQLLSEEEAKLFDRAFLGVMGVDLGGVGVDKSNYPSGFFGE